VVPAFIKSLVVVALIIEGCIIHWRLVVECLGFVGLVVKGSLLVRLRFILRWSLVNLLICRKLILS
jgi:hypothetical protein